MNRNRIRNRATWLLLLPMACLGAGGAQASEPEGVARVLTNELGAVSGARPRGRLEPVTVYFRGPALRIELKDERGNALSILKPGPGTGAWAVGADGRMFPLPHMDLPLLYDARNPCEGKGMFASCRALERGEIAGRGAEHWRYRFSNPVGPGRTTQGEMWLDRATGVVLDYTGAGRLGSRGEWRTREIEYRSVPDELFALPVAHAPGP